MGYLLKEALKALCGVNNNQWCYAIFWKIGCQNPKLLIWEECYYQSLPSSNASGLTALESQGINLQKLESYQNGVREGDSVRLLVDKMMMSNQVNVVGEGLVGRAAFSGDHQWIVSGNYNEFTHPAEVLNEVGLQFGTGIQTIAVIPVIPHGVVQFGSPSVILENVGFVHDVRSLIIRLGCIPSAFVSDDYNAKDDCMFGLPAAGVTANAHNLCPSSTQLNTNHLNASNFNLQRNCSNYVGLVNQSSNSLLSQFQDNLQVSGSSFMMANLTQDSCKSLMNELSSNNQGSSISTHSSHQVNISGSGANISSMKKEMDSGISGQQGHSLLTSKRANKVFHQNDPSMENLVCLPKTVDQPGNTRVLENVPYCNGYVLGSGHTAECAPGQVQNIDSQNVQITASRSQEHMPSVGYAYNNNSCVGSQAPPSNISVSEESLFRSSLGDDLFDVLGMDLKNKLLNSNDVLESSSRIHIKDSPKSMNLQNISSGLYADLEGGSESGVFSSFKSDHLLDAMISGVSSTSKQTSDDNMSCRTTSSKISSSSVPSTPHSDPSLSGLFTMSDSMQRRLLGLSKPVVRLSEPSGLSVGSASNKNDVGNYSMSNSTYGSPVSSWIEQGPATSVSTANSKKADEGSKGNRKRLKPGENPRPRPKDRQMIQDRVKELREIVPNGSKCSIDSLLERTIKHMLFLQSVTKHADKLKQTVESKIDKKEGGMLLKDNFEGGATWAFELGSQSMVCPIVVEDLNSPRQFLIEMMCEDRGIFLEIADIIRGLGLTILKGVMEARSDKIWARFAVEADRDVTRMEVFISLVHLLEQTLQSNNIDNGARDENVVVYPGSMAANPIVCGESSAM